MIRDQVNSLCNMCVFLYLTWLHIFLEELRSQFPGALWALVWRIGGLRRGGMYGNWESRKVITALRPRAHGKDRMSIART